MRNISLAVLLCLTLATIALTTSDSPVSAQNQFRMIGDTGTIMLRPTEVLRISGDGVDQDDVIALRFRRVNYSMGGCNGSLCRYSEVSQVVSDPITVTGSQNATLSVQGNMIGTDAVRVSVIASDPKVKLNAVVVDTVTGEKAYVDVSVGNKLMSASDVDTW